MAIRGDNLNELPTELFCNIFRRAIDPETARRDICRLILVCRQWQELVENSASLWTDISTADGPAHVRRALEKSKGALIDLDCREYATLKMDLEAFLAEAAPHIARWHSLVGKVESPRTLEGVLAPLIAAQAPCLETLELSLFGEGNSVYPHGITFFGGACAPSSLNNLNLCRIPLAFKPLNLSGLVFLSLVHVETISTPELLEMLRGSPWLETLTLANNPRLVALGPQASTMQPIELPKLDSLFFEWIDHGGTNSIISSIRIPNRRQLEIYGTIDGDSAWCVLFTPSIRHILYTDIPTADPTSSAIKVEIDEDDCTIRFRGVLLGLLMDREERVHTTLSWLVEGLGSEAAGCPVHLILNNSEMDPVRLAAVPSPLVVKHVSISDSRYSSWESHCAALGRSLHATSSEWLFPQIESLTVGLTRIEWQTELIAMLRSRYKGESPGEEAGLRSPMRLRAVELRGRVKTEGLVEEIRSILEGVDVFWVDG